MSKQNQLVIYGEVLFDCFPDGSTVLGGAPFNVAWHCQAFGMNPLFISRVGNDLQGEQVKQAMQGWGMNTAGLQFDTSHSTGIVDVSFEDGEPAYDIVQNSAWDFISIDDLPEIDEAALLYHGSLVLRNHVSAATLSYLKKTPATAVFIDINLRVPYWNLENIQSLITSCKWLKLNEDELTLIMPEKTGIEDSIKKLMRMQSLNLIVVTQGKKGVTAYDSTSCSISVNPEFSSNVIDTVGAGDSFSSVLLLGQFNKWPLKLTLQRAQQFASAIVGIRGATIKNKEFYQPFISEWQLDL